LKFSRKTKLIHGYFGQMSLKSIKLTGFKSFVDSTQLNFQSNLTAIVGPNGCGKSNIVDAIYYVLGGGSAKLRADMMADVIFNGTVTRKPVAQATIELVFDNEDRRIAGEYAQYPEISIRRELNREGSSQYYINGIRCRRRDITDIFLGTGLSYAIIEQGMVLRLIEAKPEELRAHLEEAAGVSKYKERRRETENRIQHTRENLERLNDFREEQAKQLSHLQKQASAAERYKTLKQELRLLRAQLQAIFWRLLSKQISIHESDIKVQENLLEAKITEQRHVDRESENYHLQRNEWSDTVNEIQGSYYSLGTDISALEQKITHTKERKRQLEKDQEQLEINSEEIQQQYCEDHEQVTALTQEIAKLESNAEEILQQSRLTKEQLHNSEQRMLIWEEQWDEFNARAAQFTRQIEVEKTRIQHLEQKQHALQQRIIRIQEECNKQDQEKLIYELTRIAQQRDEFLTQIENLQGRMILIHDEISQQRQKTKECSELLNDANHQLGNLQAQYASLETLQQVALGKNDNAVNSWLQQNNLQSKPRIAEGLQVEQGWEVAVEAVLNIHLDGICVDNLTEFASAIDHLETANLTLFDTQNLRPGPTKNQLTISHLIDKVKSEWPVHNLLAHVYAADDLKQALQSQPSLESHELIVTRDGILLGRGWLHVTKSVNEKSGVLQRKQELKLLSQEIVLQQKLVTQQQQHSQSVQEELQLLEGQREHYQQKIHALSTQYSHVHAQTSAKQTLIEQLKQQHAMLTEELVENQNQLAEVKQQLEDIKSSLQQAEKQAVSSTKQRANLLQERDVLRIELEQVRQQVAASRQHANEVQVRLESTKSQIHYLNQNIARSERQILALQEKRTRLEQELITIGDPLPQLNLQLQDVLEKRSFVQNELLASRQKLTAIENSLREFEKNRQRIEHDAQEIRDELEQIRLNCQTLKVKHANHLEQIEQHDYQVEQLLQELPEDAVPSNWEEKILRIENRIQRLGPINLAAIDEHLQLLEKTQYLEKQHDDLIEALTTLENAINKIDRETRMRFKDTFNQLNDSFKNYFRQIFDGGEACLELTNDDLLITGVLVKAQPPGKKTSTIQLLSGGEKALTAIALVFSFFSLNPAPFCILDEVDAPLDDVNIQRFCNLVKKMSEKIQFIFVSHNKITIEMGQQLAGVTMHEPGVSRLVSVDIEQALTMATT
jgi:chromosome segregation protein